MLRVRKYFRGSGRVLAFIFIASVIWLIFDMAALRLSFNEINSKLAREDLFRRELGGSDSWKRGSAPRDRDGQSAPKLKGVFHPPGGEHDAPKLKGVFHPPGDERDAPRSQDGQDAPKLKEDELHDPLDLDTKVRFRQRKRIIMPITFNTSAMEEVLGGRPEVGEVALGAIEERSSKNVMDAKKEVVAKNVLGGKEQGAPNKILEGKVEGAKELGAPNGLLDVNIIDVKDSRAAKDLLGVKNGGAAKGTLGDSIDKEIKDTKNVGAQEAGAAMGVFNTKEKEGSKDIPETKNVGAKEAEAPKYVKDVGAIIDVPEAKVAVEKKEGFVNGVLEAKEERVVKGVLEARDIGSKEKGVVKSVLEAKEERVVKGELEARDVGSKEKRAVKSVLEAKEEGAANGALEVKDIEAKEEGFAKGVAEAKDIGGKEEMAAKVVKEGKMEGVVKGVLEAKDVGAKDEEAAKSVLEAKYIGAKEEGVAKSVLEAKDVGVKAAGAAKAIPEVKVEAGAAKGALEAKKAVVSEDAVENKGAVNAKEFKQKFEIQKRVEVPIDIVVVDKLNVSLEKSRALPASINSAVLADKGMAAHKNEIHLSDLRVKTSLLSPKENFIGKSENKELKEAPLRDVALLRVNISSASKADVKNKRAIQQEKVSRAPRTGKHKVQILDVTQRPRNPRAPGQYGRAVSVPKDKEQESKRKWKEGNFNVYLSDLIPLDRAIEDTRPKGCSSQLVHDDLPNTSIIICFVDEVWSTLLRSVFSVLNRSPPELVKEIILVDDFSTRDYLKEKLDKFLRPYPKVRILRLKERYGLIRARIAGANIATGDVLTFLDSHIECNVGWLEPLMEQVRVNRKKVACPVIEVINDKDMSYMTVDNFQRGIFSWPLNFDWKPIASEDLEKNKITEMDPIKCPVMAGGLFSIDKKYFYELGTYDPGLDVWGGENMEISFKIWMCGGEIEIIPCSRVGHIFRKENPYSFPKDRVKTVERNLARVAEVWLDEYKEIFYGHRYHLLQDLPNIGDLTAQKELRKKLQCKSFKWYLDNVFPDMDAPVVRASGLIINPALAKCLSLQNSTVLLDVCDASKPNQHFNFTWLRLIKQKELCISPMEKDNVAVLPCTDTSNKLRWLHKSLASFHSPLESHLIMESIPRPTCLEFEPVQKRIRTNACNPSNPLQKWQFEQYFAQ